MPLFYVSLAGDEFVGGFYAEAGSLEEAGEIAHAGQPEDVEALVVLVPADKEYRVAARYIGRLLTLEEVRATDSRQKLIRLDSNGKRLGEV